MMLCRLLIILAVQCSRPIFGREWVAYPRNRSDVDACWSTTEYLDDILGYDNVKPYTSRQRPVTEFWLLSTMNESEIGRASQYPGIKHISENLEVTRDCGAVESMIPTSDPLAAPRSINQSPEPTKNPIPRSVIIQTDAPQDLDLVSWSVAKPLPRKMSGYVYDLTFGRDTSVYVIDNGLNNLNKDFRDVEWHYGYNVERKPVDDSIAGHGSCVASKAAGWKNGVSKNSRLVMMKASLTLADNNWAFAEALDDILMKGRQGKAVVVYPRLSIKEYKTSEGVPREWTSIKQIIQNLMDNDVVVVTCAGNDGTSKNVRWKLPALWCDVSDDSFPLIAAGATGPTGGYTAMSQGRNVPDRLVWAPGDSVICASGIVTRIGRGSSFSAGMVAGLASYFLSRLKSEPGSVAKDMRKKLLTYWTRPISPRQAPNVIWNGQDGSNFQLLNESGHVLGLDTEWYADQNENDGHRYANTMTVADYLPFT